jgi:DNA polymerase-3 subunit alpha/error-prone DNA polymerase
MVYQEDVIKIALHFAGVPASDGDILRRAMSGTLHGSLAKVKDNFFLRCAPKGHPLALSQEIYRQIESLRVTLLQGTLGLLCGRKLSKSVLESVLPVEFMVGHQQPRWFYRTEVYVHEANVRRYHQYSPV